MLNTVHAPAIRRSPLQSAVTLAIFQMAFVGAALAQEIPSPSSADKATELPAVTVTAAPESAQHLKAKINSGALGTRSQLDTPFSSTVVTGDDLAERQVTKLGDVFALDASVSDNSGAYTSWATYITVRGLPLDWQNSYRIDGKPFMSYATTLPYEQFEQIELLKGLSGFMYGFAEPGGMVNYVTKKPTDAPVRRVSVGYLSNSIYSEHVDLGGRFGNDDRFGYRFNATHEEGDTFYDGKIRRDSLSLALDARLTNDLTWSFNGLYQKRRAEDHLPSVFLTRYTGTDLPHTIRSDNQRLAGDGQFLDTELQYYSTGLKYRLSQDWNLRADASYSTSKRVRNEGSIYLLNPSGDYDDVRSDSDEFHQFGYYSAMLEGNVQTGSIGHQINAGVSWQKQLNDYTANSFYGSIGSGNIYEQNQNAYESPGNLYRYRDSDITQKAVFLSDTLQLTDRWSVLAGVRHTQYEQNSYAISGARTSSYDKGAVTPTLALMFKPQADTTWYTSYVESLKAGSIVPDTPDYQNRRALLKPLVSKQYEFGVKTEKARWSATAALFRIERGAEYKNSADYMVQDGEVVYQGLELAGTMRIGRQWNVLGNMMFLDTKYEKGAENIGNRVQGAPKFTAAAQVAYHVAALPGLKLMVDAKYTGNVMLNSVNTLQAPGYTLINAGASYSTRIAGRNTTFRAAINNVTDREYWEYQYDDWIKPADPRTLSVGVEVDF
ncbi:MAG TPA: TonB-dependent receptor [Oxalicibacterium sp.]|nr:TonB-dependent receptor [Oxalicibacterium sp.]